MPSAVDAYLNGDLPAPNNPLNRIELGSFNTTFDLTDIIEAVKRYVTDLLFPAIEELTGVDLSAFLPIINTVVDSLTTLFGDLNPTSGTFNPLDAVTTFIELMVEVGANLPLALIEELAGFSGGVPILSQLIGLFTGTTGGLTGLSGLGSIFGDLTGLLGNPTALGSGTPILGSAGTIPLLGPLITGLLNGGQGVNTLNLFGQLPSSIFGIIPASSIGGQSPNLLNNPGFDGAISMDGSGVWVWDASDGYNGNGCASTTADGTLKALLSNAINVQQGQTINASIRAKTVSYTGTGTPIRLMLRTYLDGAQVSTVDIQSVAGAGLTTFTQLSGSYTIPAGVDQVRLRPVVDTTATGGTVKFDFGELTKPGNGPFDGILNLFGLGALEDLFGSPTLPALGSIPILGPIFGLFGGATTATQATNFFTSITGLFGNPTGLLSGSPTVPALGSIPILGPVFGLFNGASNATQATNFITSIMSLFGNPTGTLTGSPTVPALGSIPILGPVFSLFGGATTSTGATNWVTDLLGLLGTPSAMGTGSPVVDTVGHVPIFGGLLDGLFGALTGQSSSGATQTNVQTATASQSDTVSGQGSLIAQIQAALGAGTPDSDDFERSTLGSNWTFVASTGAGTIPDSHNFHYSGSGSSAEYVMRKSNVSGSTDHITSTIVLNQAIPASFVSIPPYGGNVDVWVRMTAFTTFATRTGVRLRINSSSLAGSYSLDWVNAGTVTNLTSGSCSIPAAGAIIQLEAGAGASPRRIVGTINGSPIVDFIDTGLVTTIGAANRYRGFGGRGTSGIGFAQGTPDIRQWTAQG